jgi:hypothetical protein|tara:strand:- start:48 stop:209 length:162 start_codon:yes stop_codon:yes gene_type:complete
VAWATFHKKEYHILGRGLVPTHFGEQWVACRSRFILTENPRKGDSSYAAARFH